MCPACLTTIMLAFAGAGTTAGLSLFAVKNRRTGPAAQKTPRSSNQWRLNDAE